MFLEPLIVNIHLSVKMLMFNVEYILLCDFMSIIDTDEWTKIGRIYMI